MSKAEAREYTAEEVRELFLRHVWTMIDYWEKQPQERRSVVEGIAFSILAALDGASIEIPGFKVIPEPHEDDKEYSRAQGENWFPFYNATEPCDIGGSLHDMFYPVKEKIDHEKP